MSNFFDQFDAPTHKNFFDQFDPQPAAPVQHSTWADVGLSAAKGLQNGVNGIIGLPGTVQNAVNSAGDWAHDKLFGPPSPQAQAAANAVRASTILTPGDLKASEDRIAQALTGSTTDYTPQTTAGRYAQTVGEFVPMALATGGESGMANLVRQALIPGAAAETAGHAVAGTSIEPYVRGAAAMGAGGAAGLTALPGAVDRQLARAGAGMTDPAASIAAAQKFMEYAKASTGISVTLPEALDHITNGAANAGNAMRITEMIPEGRAVTQPFFAQRPGQVSAAVGQTLDQVAPSGLPPSVNGLLAQGAAERGIDAVRQDINAGTRPLYKAAEGVQIPAPVMTAVSTPSFQQSLAALRADPILGPQHERLPDNSIGVIDAVTKDMLSRAEQAKNSSAAGFNPQRGAIQQGDAGFARDMATRVSPDYAQALAEQEARRKAELDPLSASSAGKIATTPDVQAQTGALFPNAPPAGIAPETMRTIQLLEKQSPGAGAALVRQYLESKFAEAGKNLVSGPNQNAGALFAKGVAGNPIQADNLVKGVGALPNGATAGPAVSNLLDVLAATGRRQALGTLTAPNQTAIRDLSSVGPVGSIESARPFAAVHDWLARRTLGSRAEDLANVLLGANPAESAARYRSAIENQAPLGNIFLRGMGQGYASQQ